MILADAGAFSLGPAPEISGRVLKSVSVCGMIVDHA